MKKRGGPTGQEEDLTVKKERCALVRRRPLWADWLVIALVVLAVVAITCAGGMFFGSKTDWLGQHTAFPDYFRKLFYQTGELLPNFALGIGAGQNIYNFSYYGLLSPLVLFSYLLPFVPMTIYMAVANVVGTIVTGILFYQLLRREKFSQNVCLVTSLLLITSSSLIFQAHRHFMFVNYMPFLLLALLGAHRYFEKGSRWLLCLSVFLMVMTSYYYSVAGIVVVVLYGVYLWLKVLERRDRRFTVKSFLVDGLRFLLPVICGVAMAAVLLLPTFWAILGGRESGVSKTAELLDLLVPKANLDGLLYSPYSLGFGAVAVLAVLWGFFAPGRPRKFLHITFAMILALPLSLYLFNGALYLRNKALIPFAPIVGVMLAGFLADLAARRVRCRQLALLFVLANAVFWLLGYKNLIYYAEAAVILTLCFFCARPAVRRSFYAVILCLSFATCLIANSTDELVSEEMYERVFPEEKQQLVDAALDAEDGLWRFGNLDDTLYNVNYVYRPDYLNTSVYSSTQNADYKSFRDDTFRMAQPYRNKLVSAQTPNALFQLLMSTRYVVTDGDPGAGYQPVQTKGDYTLYRSDYALPLGYVTYRTVSQSAYNRVGYPYSLDVMLHQTVVPDESDLAGDSPISWVLPTDLPDGWQIGPYTTITPTDDGWDLQVTKSDKLHLDLGQGYQDNLLLIGFNVKNIGTHKDIKIGINGVENKLAYNNEYYQAHHNQFEYVISSSERLTALDVTLSPGNYHISNLQVHMLPVETLRSAAAQVTPFTFDKQKSLAGNVSGQVTAQQDGYFVTSIPYDEGFTAYVDGKEQKIEKVNQAFVGFPLKQGAHTVELRYTAPLFRAGAAISAAGLAGLAIMVLLDLRAGRKRRAAAGQ